MAFIGTGATLTAGGERIVVVGGNALAIEHKGPTNNYGIETRDELDIYPETGSNVYWDINGSLHGIRYERGTNNGFFNVPNVTVRPHGISVNGGASMDSVSAIQAAISTALGGSGDTVTVTGKITVATSTLSINIPAGKTLIWAAEYPGNPGSGNSLISLTGTGRFEVPDAGTIRQEGTSHAISATSSENAPTIVLNGGTVLIPGAASTTQYPINSIGSVLIEKNTNIRTINGNITVQSGVTLTVPSGQTFSIPASRTLLVHGTVQNNGTISTNSSSAITINGTINNNGTINISNGCTFSLYGTFQNNGTVTLDNNSYLILMTGHTYNGVYPLNGPRIVRPPNITTTSPLPGGTYLTAYSQTLSPTGEGTYSWAVTSGSLPGGLTLNTSTGVISGTPSAAGSFTFSVRVANQAGNFTREFTIVIAKRAPVIADLTFTDPNTIKHTYTGQPQGIGSVTTARVGFGGITVFYEGTNGTSYPRLNEPPSGSGEYNVTVDIAEGTNYLAVSAIFLGVYTIEDNGSEAVEAALNALTWNTIRNANTLETSVTSNLTLPLTGIHETTISWASTEPTIISSTGVVRRPAFVNGNMVLTLTATVSKGTASDTKFFLLTVPSTPLPTGTVTIAGTGWNSLRSNIPFGLFSIAPQNVTISATNNGGGAVTTRYHLASSELDEAQLLSLAESSWLFYTGAFSLSQPGRYIVYVRLTDTTGNVNYFNSNGVVIYQNSTAVTTSISFEKGSVNNMPAQVTLNGNTINRIMNGAATLNDTHYSISGGTITFYASYLNSLATGNHSITIHYNPRGVVFPTPTPSGSTAPSTTTIALTINEQTYSATVSGGTISGGASTGNFTEGTFVTIVAAEPPTGQQFKEWTVSSAVQFAVGTGINTPTVRFVMPARAVTVTAVYETIPVGSNIIAVTSSGNGVANADRTSAAPDVIVTLTATADAGHLFKEWQVIDGTVVLVTSDTANPATFVMPNTSVTVQAVFEEIPFVHTWNSGTVTCTLNASGVFEIFPRGSITGAMANYADAAGQPWAAERSLITSVVIHPGVTSIGDNAFRDCTNLTSITFSNPNDLTGIGFYAFYNTRLPAVSLPGGLRSIGGNAFGANPALLSFTIPGTVTSIGANLFGSATVENNTLQTLTIAEGVTQLGSNAFSYCNALTTISLPVSLLTINDSAFANSNLAGFTAGIPLPASLQNIGNSAFRDTNMPAITLPGGLRSIGQNAFVGTEIESLTIPGSVTSIGGESFGTSTISNETLRSLTISNGVTQLGSGAFAHCEALTSVSLPNTLTIIDNYAFQNCVALPSINIPASVTHIGSYAFQMPEDEDSALTTVTFGTNSVLNTIGAYAFRNSEKLANIVLPQGFRSGAGSSVGIQAFWGTGLVSVTIPSNFTFGTSSGVYGGINTLETVIFEDGRTSIPAGIFIGSNNIDKIQLPNTVTSINAAAFPKRADPAGSGANLPAVEARFDSFAVYWARQVANNYRVELLPYAGIMEANPPAVLHRFIPYEFTVITGVPYNQDIRFSISPALPAGMFFETGATTQQTGKLPGTVYGSPHVYSGNIDFTVTARPIAVGSDDRFDATASFTINLADIPESASPVMNPQEILTHIGDEDADGNRVVTGFTDLVFLISRDFDEATWAGLWINGIEKTRNLHYSVEKGSTRVTIHTQTVQDLDEGDHTVAAAFYSAPRETGLDHEQWNAVDRSRNELNIVGQNFTVAINPGGGGGGTDPGGGGGGTDPGGGGGGTDPGSGGGGTDPGGGGGGTDPGSGGGGTDPGSGGGGTNPGSGGGGTDPGSGGTTPGGGGGTTPGDGTGAGDGTTPVDGNTTPGGGGDTGSGGATPSDNTNNPGGGSGSNDPGSTGTGSDDKVFQELSGSGITAYDNDGNPIAAPNVEVFGNVELTETGFTKALDGSGTPLELRFDIPFSEFTGLHVNGILWVQGVDYTARAGSTIISIPEDRLKEIESGEHKMLVVFNNQTVEVNFTLNNNISDTSPGTESGTPGTIGGSPDIAPASSRNIILIAGLILAVLAGATGILIIIKRRRQS